MSPQRSKKFLTRKWRALREDSGLTLKEGAGRLGISSSYLSKIETGQANISFDVLERLADFYNQNILFFFLRRKTPMPEDSIFFHSNEKHNWHNNGSTVATALWIYSPFRD